MNCENTPGPTSTFSGAPFREFASGARNCNIHPCPRHIRWEDGAIGPTCYTQKEKNTRSVCGAVNCFLMYALVLTHVISMVCLSLRSSDLQNAENTESSSRLFPVTGKQLHSKSNSSRTTVNLTAEMHETKLVFGFAIA